MWKKNNTNEICLHIYARILIDLLTYFSVKTLWLSKRCVIVSWFFLWISNNNGTRYSNEYDKSIGHPQHTQHTQNSMNVNK